MAAPNIQIRSTNTVGTNTGIKILVIGPPGAGKTRLCATMPNPIILSAEGGLLSLRKSNLPFVEIKNVQDFSAAWRWVSESREARQFASICIDSISEIAENELKFAKTQTKDGRKAYGDTQEQVTNIIKNFRNLQGPHIYFTGKQTMLKNNNGGVFPALMMPGQNLGPQIPFEFDECYQLVPAKTAEGKRFSALRCQGSSEFDMVKNRGGGLAEWEGPVEGSDIPHLGNIIAKIMKG